MHGTALSLFAALAGITGVYAEVGLHPRSPAHLSGASKSCLAAFNGGVDCVDEICSLYAHKDRYFIEPELYRLCSDECYKSLVAHRQKIEAECDYGVKYYPKPNNRNSFEKVTHLADRALKSFNRTCLKRSDGQYCRTVLHEPSWAAAVARQEAPKAFCEECYRAILMDSSENQGDLLAMFDSMIISQCAGVDGDETAKGLSEVTAESKANCSALHIVRPGDTYLSVSQARKMSTADLVSANGLHYRPENFPRSGRICISNQCNVHVVEEGDECDTVAAKHSITVARLLSFNPSLQGSCYRLPLIIGQTICISRPLRMHTHNPAAKLVTAQSLEIDISPPIALQTREDCWAYMRYGHDALNLDCRDMAITYDLSEEQFLAWNPSLAKERASDAKRKFKEGCTLQPGVSYCVGLAPSADQGSDGA